MERFAVSAAAALVAWVGLISAAHAQDPDPAVATIRVTNLTKGQILTPAVFVTHSPEAPALFVPGKSASSELASLAEQGITSGLINKFSAESAVLAVARLASFIRPGKSATISVKFDASHRLVSSASMIEMTNDGFVSLLAVEVPCEGVATHFLKGWDAGSEANTELCSQIPAPCPSPPRSGSCSAARVEGFVHVHAGIHGCGGFPQEVYDWRHPVAMVEIQPSVNLSPAGSLAAACADP